MDTSHLTTWLHCLPASGDLENDVEAPTREVLGGLLDLPPSYGGAGLHSLENDADEEFLGSYAGITSSLITFCRRTELPVYIRFVEALEDLDPLEQASWSDHPVRTPCATISEVLEVAERSYAPTARVTSEELQLATQLVRGHNTAEVPGAWNHIADAPQIRSFYRNPDL
jgi:hypothetical protein